MLLNDVMEDLEEVIHFSRYSKSDIARELGITRQNLNSTFARGWNINNRFIEIAEVLGYDVEVRLVKKS